MSTSFLSSTLRFTEQDFRNICNQLGFYVSPVNMRGPIDIFDANNNTIKNVPREDPKHKYVYCEAIEMKVGSLPNYLAALRSNNDPRNKVAFYEVYKNFDKEYVKFALINESGVYCGKVNDNDGFLKK